MKRVGILKYFRVIRGNERIRDQKLIRYCIQKYKRRSMYKNEKFKYIRVGMINKNKQIIVVILLIFYMIVYYNYGIVLDLYFCFIIK